MKCSTTRPACLGLSDGGAHCTSIVDAGVPTFMLTHWSRDRSRGPKLPVEMLVKRQTSETADFFGLADRGRLAPGLRADVNLIDYGRLQVQKPELVHDMPANGRRFVQRVDGYEATLVAGDADLRARRAHRRAAGPPGARRQRAARRWRRSRATRRMWVACQSHVAGAVGNRLPQFTPRGICLNVRLPASAVRRV